MALISKTYGKGRVRVLRVRREVPGMAEGWHEVREMSVQAMVTGDFGNAFTEADNSASICTDTVKNIVNVVAREHLEADKEAFCVAVAQKLLALYPMLDGANVTGHETVWRRMEAGGTVQPHGFVLDANGRPFARVKATREGTSVESGLSGFTFLKSTQSGWANYVKEPFTTLAETDDRIAATAMEASWLWNAPPADYGATNARILDIMLSVFASTYSRSVQDSLYRMATAALEAVPEIDRIAMACPNKHYIPINLAPFGLANANQVFVATDEPHGQIECVVGRG